MDNHYVYHYGGRTYVNLTNRCNNNCDFCIRKNPIGIEGYDLWLNHEPEAEDVIRALGPAPGDVIFCGYGEPTMRLDVLKQVAKYVHACGGKVRVNTNGLANAQYARDVVCLLYTSRCV